MYIQDQNTRLSPHMIGVMYLDYILLLLLCDNCSLHLNMVGFKNMLLLTISMITLIKFIQKWTGILYIISNSKLGIGLCSRPIVDVTVQSNLYDVLSL